VIEIGGKTMNQRENFKVILEGGQPEFIPILFEVYKICFGPVTIDSRFGQGGLDPFGVNWIVTRDGAIPEPNKFMFNDIADWKKYVRIPDVKSLGIEQAAEMELTDVNRDEMVVNCFGSACGVFQRLVSMMGFENALCALVENPDACYECFEAIADYLIAFHNAVIDAYHPDVITYNDDLASARGLFMSPKIYRELIKPHTKRIYDAIIARGVIVSQHDCGKCEEIVDDFVEMGAQIWSSAHPSNNLEAIQKKHKGRLIVEGGWDTAGPASYFEATTEEVIDEAVRCAKQYGKHGNFILMPGIKNEQGEAMLIGDPRFFAMMEAWHKLNKLS